MKTLSIVAAAFVAAGSGAAMGAPKEVTLTVPTMDCATCPVTIVRPEKVAETVERDEQDARPVFVPIY